MYLWHYTVILSFLHVYKCICGTRLSFWCPFIHNDDVFKVLSFEYFRNIWFYDAMPLFLFVCSEFLWCTNRIAILIYGIRILSYAMWFLVHELFCMISNIWTILYAMLISGPCTILIVDMQCWFLNGTCTILYAMLISGTWIILYAMLIWYKYHFVCVVEFWFMIKPFWLRKPFHGRFLYSMMSI